MQRAGPVGRICNLLLSLCELSVFVEALLHVILKARASFISVTVHPFSSSSKKKITVIFIDVQVTLWMP